jgi:short-subunit dehydrogenase
MHIGAFEDIGCDKLKEMCDTNMYGLSILTKLFSERMLKRNTRSAIVNVSSAGGYIPVPYDQHYAGTKSFVTIFTKALGFEVSAKIDVLCHCPGYVETNLNSFHKSFDTAQPRECAHSIFRDLGFERDNQPTAVQEFGTFFVHAVSNISETAIMHLMNFTMKDLHKEMADKKNV